MSEPRSLLPALASSVVEGQLADLMFDRLANPRPGASPFDDRGYAPGLATEWRWNPDRRVITFRLDPAARWHDGTPVTSADVRFTFRLLSDSMLGSRKAIAMRAVDSVSTPDVRTAIVWCHRSSATLFHDLTFATHILPAHLLDTVPAARLMASTFARHPVGSGAFRFVRWDPAVAIHLERDVGYGGTPRASAVEQPGTPVRRVVFRFYASYDGAVAGLESREIDVLGYVRPNDAARLVRRTDVSVRSAPGYDYVYLLFNLRPTPRQATSAVATAAGPTAGGEVAFRQASLRRALSMAVDRRALAAAVVGPYGRVALGPVTHAMPVANLAGRLDETPAFDPDAARRALDALGWRVGPDGARHRGAATLAFDLLVPASSASRRYAAVVLQAMFKAVGAQVTVSITDAAAFQSAMERGAFDTALEGMTADPSPAQVRELWSTQAGVRRGRDIVGFNYGGFASAAVDAMLDSAAASESPADAIRLYRYVYRTLTADVPAIFLYEPDASIALSRRVRAPGLHAEAWWADVANWRLLPGGDR